MTDSQVVTEPAPAKINPYLKVLSRRDDGFHEIETLVLPVTLADGVQAVPAPELRLSIVGELAGDVPADEDNLVWRAAGALRDHVGESRGAHLLLSKRIPVAAGLGGGSADAAATLRALDRLWKRGLGIEGLIEVAAGVGSDVPALLRTGPVIARGGGERVEPVDLPRTWWVLLSGKEKISAADAYAWWDSAERAGDSDLEPLLVALREGLVEEAGKLLRNDLQGPVIGHHPQIETAIGRVEDAGALGAIVSGSGPTVAGLARDGAHAEQLASLVDGAVVASMGAAN